MIFGAHVSSAGGIENAPQRASEIQADCIQIFASPPQSFTFVQPSEFQIELFRYRIKRRRIDPVFFHGIYLINLASDNRKIQDLSIQSLTLYQDLALKLGAKGTIFHLGSHKGRGFRHVFDSIVKSLRQILANSSPTLFLIIENSVQARGKIGAKFFEIGSIIKKVKDLRLKVCLDTCHLFVSGYPIHQKDGLEKTLRDFDKEIGLGRLVAIHANDSRTPFLSAIDRHEDIGKGYIGSQGFKNIVNHPILKNLPFIIETPGFDNSGPDKKNIKILRSLVK
jgi:deoxyribonuclease-4